jgi:hypothetical protein
LTLPHGSVLIPLGGGFVLRASYKTITRHARRSGKRLVVQAVKALTIYVYLGDNQRFTILKATSCRTGSAVFGAGVVFFFFFFVVFFFFVE